VRLPSPIGVDPFWLVEKLGFAEMQVLAQTYERWPFEAGGIAARRRTDMIWRRTDVDDAQALSESDGEAFSL
jgi:hypothetical protein